MATRIAFVVGVLFGAVLSAQLANMIHTQQLIDASQPVAKEQTCVVEMQHRGKYGSNPVKVSMIGKVKS